MSVSKMVTTMLRHFDQEERQTDGSRHCDSIEPVLMRAFAHEGAQDFSDINWLRLIHKARILHRYRWEYMCWWYSNKSRIDEIHVYSIQMEGVHQPQSKFVKFTIYFGELKKFREERRRTELDRQSF